MDSTLRTLLACLVTAAALMLPAPIPARAQNVPSSGETALGQQTFSVCAGCHGLDGRGGEHAPNIATDPKVAGLSDGAVSAIVRNGIPTAGMPGFSKTLNEHQIQAVVAYLKVLRGGTSPGVAAGNRGKGKLLFFGRAGCSECHMIDGKGGFFGADLSVYGSSHSPDAIRDAILNPDKNVDVHHAIVSVVTRKGTKYRGLVRNEDNFSLQMQTRDGIFHFFDKADLTRIDLENRSGMPADYQSKLTKSELDDLVSFLSPTSGRQEKQESEDDE